MVESLRAADAGYLMNERTGLAIAHSVGRVPADSGVGIRTIRHLDVSEGILPPFKGDPKFFYVASPSGVQSNGHEDTNAHCAIFYDRQHTYVLVHGSPR